MSMKCWQQYIKCLMIKFWIIPGRWTAFDNSLELSLFIALTFSNWKQWILSSQMNDSFQRFSFLWLNWQSGWSRCSQTSHSSTVPTQREQNFYSQIVRPTFLEIWLSPMSAGTLVCSYLSSTTCSCKEASVKKSNFLLLL